MTSESPPVSHPCHSPRRFDAFVISSAMLRPDPIQIISSFNRHPHADRRLVNHKLATVIMLEKANLIIIPFAIKTIQCGVSKLAIETFFSEKRPYFRIRLLHCVAVILMRRCANVNFCFPQHISKRYISFLTHKFVLPGTLQANASRTFVAARWEKLNFKYAKSCGCFQRSLFNLCH